MNSRTVILLGVVASALTGLGSSTSDAWAEDADPLARLPHRRQIEIDPRAIGGQWIAVLADDALASRTPPFADVRISDDAGRLVPCFTITPRDTDVRWRPIPSDSLAWRDDPHAGRVLDVMIEPSTEPVLIVLADAATFLRLGTPSIRVMGGRDQRRWRPLDASISTMTDLTGTLVVVAVPERSPRYVRLIAPTDASPPLPAPMLYTESSESAPRDEAVFTVTADRRDQEWRYSLDLAATRSIAGVVLASIREDAFWQPRIELEVAADRWRELRSVETRAYRADALDHVAFSPEEATGVRVSIAGFDGTTSPITPIAVEVVPTRFVLRVPSDATALFVNYGDPLLESTGAIEQRVVMRTATITLAELGPEVANPLYAPRGLGWNWARRHPAVLTIAMMLVLALIAGIVLRDARRST